jgi:hypothetical protein
MQNQDDRAAIDGLFDRIEDVARNSQPRDPDAETLMQRRLQEFPPAPYYMAQTILIQEEALRQAQARIEQLERQGQQRGGGILGGMFGGVQPQQQQPARRRGPWDRGSDYEEQRGRSGSGGFLAGAAQTALGVTGGVLLGSAIAGMLTGGAQADEYNPDAEAEADPGVEDVDAGGDDFGGGDFDMGGDF